MPRTTFSRFLLTLVLVAALAVPAVAAPRSRHVAQPPNTSLLNALYGYLTHLWAEIGCGADPSGHCTAATPTADAGCGIDPDGRCTAATLTTDAGCIADPDGRCLSAPAAAIRPQPRLDAGCGGDPNGICTTNH